MDFDTVTSHNFFYSLIPDLPLLSLIIYQLYSAAVFMRKSNTTLSTRVFVTLIV